MTEPKLEEQNFIESEQTEPLRGAIGLTISHLEDTAKNIYRASNLPILPGLDIRQLPEYLDAICAISNLREAAARGYHKQYNIPLK